MYKTLRIVPGKYSAFSVRTDLPEFALRQLFDDPLSPLRILSDFGVRQL